MKQCHQLACEKHFLSVNEQERNWRKLRETKFHLPLFIKHFPSSAAEQLQDSFRDQGSEQVPLASSSKCLKPRLQRGTEQHTS